MTQNQWIVVDFVIKDHEKEVQGPEMFRNFYISITRFLSYFFTTFSSHYTPFQRDLRMYVLVKMFKCCLLLVIF